MSEPAAAEEHPDSAPAPPPAGLYEREREWARLQRALASASSGSGELILIEGQPGVGKTRLLGASQELAAGAGLGVLAARGSELEREFGFGVCLQLFERAVASAGDGEREQLFAGAAGLASPLFAGGKRALAAAPGEEAHVLAHGLFWLACNLAELHGPMLLAVDDAQWSDLGSLAFLGHLAARLGDVPVALVATVRTGEPATPRALALLRDQASADRLLTPAPLSERAVELLTRESFPEADAGFTRACAHASAGNPFLLGELLRSLRDDTVAPSAGSAAAIERIVPESVLSSVLTRLAHLPDSAVALAGAAAVLGDGAPLRHAAALAGLDAEGGEEAADALASAHILRPGEPLSFTHPLIAAAVESDLPAHAAARAHRRAARLVEGDGAPLEAVAAHLLAAPGDGEPWAVEVLAAAATRASAGGDPAAAARLLARALDEPATAEQRPGLLLDLAHAEAAAGGPGAERRIDEALELVADPEARALAHRASGRLLLARARYEQAADAFQRGLGELPADDPLAEELLADLFGAQFFVAAGRTAANGRFSALVEEARAGGFEHGPGLLGPLAATLACRNRDVELVRPLAEACLASLAEREEGSHGVLSAFAIAALLFVDELDLAERAVGLELERARSGGSSVAYAIACHWQARLYLRRGRLAESVGSAEQALELGRSGGWSAAALAEAQIERGELDRAEEAIALIEQADRGGIERAFLLHARGRVALARDQDAAAVEELAAAGRHLREHYEFDNPIMLGWRGPAVLATIRLGDRSGAAALAEEALGQARTLGSSTARGAALRAAGLAAGGERALELFAESVEALEGSPAALERARALIDLGGAMRRSGQRVACREPLLQGLETADACGALPLADHALEELRASGARPRRAAISGVGSLTPSELRVARLAADGLTNKQIAQALFVTTKTVESHLRHAFTEARPRLPRPAAGRARDDSVVGLGDAVPERRRGSRGSRGGHRVSKQDK